MELEEVQLFVLMLVDFGPADLQPANLKFANW
jgi:hypothetical protein